MKLTLALLLFTLMLGCATVPELTPEQVTQINQVCNDDAVCIVEATDKAMVKLLEDIEYDREVAALQRKEDVLAYIQGCKGAGMVLISVGHGIQSISDRRWTKKRWEDLTIHDISRHQRVSDFRCGTPGDIMRDVF